MRKSVLFLSPAPNICSRSDGALQVLILAQPVLKALSMVQGTQLNKAWGELRPYQLFHLFVLCWEQAKLQLS